MLEFEKEKFADRLKSAVKKAGGNDKVAGLTGVSSVNISRYVTGRTMPSAEMLARIAHACDISADQLLYGDSGTSLDQFEEMDVLNTVKHVASQVANLDHPHIKINIQAEAFGDAFSKLVKYKLEENASSETMDNVIKFSFSK